MNVNDCNNFAKKVVPIALGNTITNAIKNVDYSGYKENMSLICEIGENTALTLW